MEYENLKFKPDSYADKALKLLIKGYKLSTLNMLTLVGTLDGRKIISDLRKAGVPIADESIPIEGKKPCKRYFIKPSA